MKEFFGLTTWMKTARASILKFEEVVMANGADALYFEMMLMLLFSHQEKGIIHVVLQSGWKP